MSKPSFSDTAGRGLARFSIAARFLLVPIVAALCVAAGYNASKLDFAGDYRVFFGPNNPDLIAAKNAEDTFGKADNIAFVIIPKSGSVYTRRTLSAVHTLTNQGWTLPYVTRVESLTNFQNTIGRDDDLIVEDLVFDPTELTEARLNEIRAIAESEPLIDGFIVSRGGDATVVNVTVQFPSDVPNVNTIAQNQARALRDDLMADYPDLDVHIIGAASLAAAFEESGLKDTTTLIPALYAIVLIAVLIVLRSFSAMIAVLLVIALSTMVGVGFGGFTGIELTPISVSAPTIILTIAVADAIHIIASIRSKMRAGANKRDAIIDATALNFAPVSITSLTTVAGFLTLNFSDSPTFHDLGNMTAVGIAAAWALSLTFLPAVLAILPMKFKAKAMANDAAPTGVTAVVANAVIAQPWAFALATSALCVALAVFIPKIEINDQWTRYFDERVEFRQAIDASRPYFGSDIIEMVVDPGAPGAVAEPEFLTTVEAFTAWLRTRESDIAHVFSLTDIIKRLNKNLNGDDPTFYAIPDDRTLASQYLLVYELSLPYGLDLNNRVDIDRQSTRVTVTTQDITTNEIRALVADAKTWFAENGNGYALDVTGSNVLFAFAAQRNLEAVAQGAIYLLIAILVILALTFRSIPVGLVSLVPNILPILAAFGAWAILVGVVGFSIAAVGAVAVGLVVDDTVHFLSKYFRARRIDGKSAEEAIRYAFATAGQAIMLTTFILAAGFSVLVGSTFKLNADLGLLTAIAIVLALIIDFTLLPAMLLIAGRKRSARTSGELSPQGQPS
ncbi:MAG: MMPL family transporter [Pseudomonadota bacterium]